MRRCDDRIRKLEAAGRADKLKLRRLARDSAARKGEGEGGEVELIEERLRWRGLPPRAIVAAEGGDGAAAAGAPGGEQVLLGLCLIGSVANIFSASMY